MRHWNALQSISFVGIIFSIIVQIALLIIDKKVETLWALYPTWIVIFVIGTLFKYFSKPEEDHHHHH